MLVFVINTGVHEPRLYQPTVLKSLAIITVYRPMFFSIGSKAVLYITLTEFDAPVCIFSDKEEIGNAVTAVKDAGAKLASADFDALDKCYRLCASKRLCFQQF